MQSVERKTVHHQSRASSLRGCSPSKPVSSSTQASPRWRNISFGAKTNCSKRRTNMEKALHCHWRHRPRIPRRHQPPRRPKHHNHQAILHTQRLCAATTPRGRWARVRMVRLQLPVFSTVVSRQYLPLRLLNARYGTPQDPVLTETSLDFDALVATVAALLTSTAWHRPGQSQAESIRQAD